MLTAKDRELANAAIHLHRAARNAGQTTAELPDEELADVCVAHVLRFIESFEYCCFDNEEAVKTYVSEALWI